MPSFRRLAVECKVFALNGLRIERKPKEAAAFQEEEEEVGWFLPLLMAAKSSNARFVIVRVISQGSW